MKHFIVFAIVICLCITTASAYTYREMDALRALLNGQEDIMKEAHEEANLARAIGDSARELEAKDKWNEASTLWKGCNCIYSSLNVRWQQKEKEHEAAAYIWKYFMRLGYSDEVIAGILGNIMAEAGGQTLNIQWWIYSGGYYGMCMWSLRFCSEVNGASLEKQCDYLRDTLQRQLTAFGYSYENFCATASPEVAALLFAKGYERCGSGSYTQRQRNARIAYNYFLA